MEDNPLFKNFQEKRLALSFEKYTFSDELFSDWLQFLDFQRNPGQINISKTKMLHLTLNIVFINRL